MASGYIPVLVLAVVFLLIVFRKVGNFRVKIWQAMMIGAVAVLLTMQITPIDALFSINYDVMLFLFGMFVVGESMQESGYLRTLSHRLFGNRWHTRGVGISSTAQYLSKAPSVDSCCGRHDWERHEPDR